MTLGLLNPLLNLIVCGVGRLTIHAVELRTEFKWKF